MRFLIPGDQFHEFFTAVKVLHVDDGAWGNQLVDLGPVEAVGTLCNAVSMRGCTWT